MISEFDFTALAITLKLATVATLILLIFGTPFAWWLARSQWRFKFILEAYEGVAVLTTLDPHLGTVELFIGPGCENDVTQIVNDLSKHILVEDFGR